MDEQVSVQLISALAACWSAIRERHPVVPGVVLLPAPAQRGHLNVLGHFAPVRWRARAHDEHLLHEVVVVAEHLDRGATNVFETLLHEAAHAANFDQGVFDCSPTSQYHNARFKDRAEELGLEVAKVRNYGWAYTGLAEPTRLAYATVIGGLEETLVHRRKFVIGGGPNSGPLAGGETPSGAKPQEEAANSGRSRKAVCACPHIIRVSRKVMAATTIRCDSCGASFVLD